MNRNGFGQVINIVCWARGMYVSTVVTCVGVAAYATTSFIFVLFAPASSEINLRGAFTRQANNLTRHSFCYCPGKGVLCFVFFKQVLKKRL